MKCINARLLRNRLTFRTGLAHSLGKDSNYQTDDWLSVKSYFLLFACEKTHQTTIEWLSVLLRWIINIGILVLDSVDKMTTADRGCQRFRMYYKEDEDMIMDFSHQFIFSYIVVWHWHCDLILATENFRTNYMICCIPQLYEQLLRLYSAQSL